VIDNSGNGYIQYVPHIEYEYVVGGVKYMGWEYDQLKASNREKHIVEEYLVNYPINKTIKVEYDTRSPDFAGMLNESDYCIIIIFKIISISLFILGIIGLLFQKIRKR
jgi:hypothetical protein